MYQVVQERKGMLQGERVELPTYILEHHIPIDYMFYIKKQIEIPCRQFLELYNPEQAELIFKNAENYFKRKQAGLNTDIKNIYEFNKKDDDKKKSKFSMAI